MTDETLRKLEASRRRTEAYRLAAQESRRRAEAARLETEAYRRATDEINASRKQLREDIKASIAGFREIAEGMTTGWKGASLRTADALQAVLDSYEPIG